MTTDKINTIKNNLESKIAKAGNAIVYLTSQGYFINRNKHIKLSWMNMLLNAFNNIDIFTEDQKDNLEGLYNIVCNI